jgi:hypothetical protein
MKDDARAATLSLLADHRPGATICPSDVARAIAAAAASPDWRAQMPAVHAAVDALVAGGLATLSWKGVPLEAREGPYRIRRAGGAKSKG